jgi:hypothetical protein
MAGIAVATAELYARYNIPSIPLGKNKRPSVKGYKIDTLTVDESRGFMRQRPNADALGVPDGRLSGIVRLDIDGKPEDVERVARELILRAGDTPAKVRTASGKMHMLFAHNGERRLTGKPGQSNARPWDDLPVDLCGNGGYSVSPPSRSKGGDYKLLGDLTLEELLEKRDRLPIIKGLDARAYSISGASSAAIAPPDDFADMREHSGRNVALFNALCKEARGLPPTLQAFVDRGRELNQQFGEPMLDSRVVNTAKSVFGYLERGELRTGEHGAWFKEPQVQSLVREPYLFALIGWLKAKNGPDAEFWIANGLAAAHLGWPEDQLRKARNRAMELGWIEMIVTPAKGRNALYRWGPTTQTSHW